jgi:3-hydroxyacyl-CoA dehydrogenase/3a,7a,12a-trihydroxy-5b-cholest-24-enoyl-CoA hydratase
VVDLQAAPGSVKEGTRPNPTATLTLSEEDLLALVKDPGAVKDLYMHGKLRVDGDVRVAQHLGFLKQLI